MQPADQPASAPAPAAAAAPAGQPAAHQTTPGGPGAAPAHQPGGALAAPRAGPVAPATASGQPPAPRAPASLAKQQQLAPAHHNQAHQGPASQGAQQAGLPLSSPQFSLANIEQQQQQQTAGLDHRVMVAYGIIIVCMVILVVLLVLRLFFERLSGAVAGQRLHARPAHSGSIWPTAPGYGHSRHAHQRHHDRARGSRQRAADVATLQNHENIYKSRTSLSQDKVPFGEPADVAHTDDTCSSVSSGSSDEAAEYGRAGVARPAPAHGYGPGPHQGPAGRDQPPPPPYTIARSHPGSAYAPAGSIYHHPASLVLAAGGAPIYAANSAYGSAAGQPAGAQEAAERQSGAPNEPGAPSGAGAYQSPYYVIYHIL